MVEKNMSGLPVVDETGLVGIVSEKDVLTLLYANDFVAGPVEAYMTSRVISFDEEDSLTDICDCLIKNNFRRVPILNQGKVVGIISRADIIVSILKNRTAFSRLPTPAGLSRSPVSQ